MSRASAGRSKTSLSGLAMFGFPRVAPGPAAIKVLGMAAHGADRLAQAAVQLFVAPHDDRKLANELGRKRAYDERATRSRLWQRQFRHDAAAQAGADDLFDRL